MNEKFLKLLDIDECVFEKTLNIIFDIIPYIQDSDIEYIIYFQNYFCSKSTVYKNCTNIKKYIDSNVWFYDLNC